MKKSKLSSTAQKKDADLYEDDENDENPVGLLARLWFLSAEI